MTSIKLFEPALCTKRETRHVRQAILAKQRHSRSIQAPLLFPPQSRIPPATAIDMFVGTAGRTILWEETRPRFVSARSNIPALAVHKPRLCVILVTGSASEWGPRLWELVNGSHLPPAPA